MSAAESARGRAFEPETYERPSWRRAAELIEEVRSGHTNDYDPAEWDIAGLHGALKMAIEWIFESGQYDEQSLGVPSQLARGIAGIIMEIRDRGLKDYGVIAELLQYLIAAAFDSEDGDHNMVLLRMLALTAAHAQDHKAVLQ